MPPDFVAGGRFGIIQGMPDASRHPAGKEPAHDILAAEEFAMPAPGPGTRAQRGPGRRARVGSWLGLAAAVLALKRALRQLRR